MAGSQGSLYFSALLFKLVSGIEKHYHPLMKPGKIMWEAENWIDRQCLVFLLRKTVELYCMPSTMLLQVSFTTVAFTSRKG